MDEKIIYLAGHSSYIKLSAVLDEHGLMADKEDELIQDILNTLGVPEMVERTPEIHAPLHKRFYDHGIDTLGDESG